MGKGHLILGNITDFITGETIRETHDEQLLQEIARLMVEKRGYDKKEIIPKYQKKLETDQKKAILTIDFLVRFLEKTHMIIKYGPGSLTTRHRAGLAASRLIEPYQIPVVVITNGRDADILDGTTGKLVSSGLQNIPLKSDLAQGLKQEQLDMISDKQREVEARIIYAFEVNDSCCL